MTSRLTQTGKLGLALSLGVLAALLVAIPATARAQEDPGPPPGPERHLDMLIERLDLRADQEKELRELFTAHREAMKGEMESLGAARRELDDQIRAETVSEPAIREAAAKLAALEADLAVDRAYFHQNVRKILDAEQLARFDDMHQRRQERMAVCMGDGPGPYGKGRHHGRHGRGPGPRWGDTD